MSESIPLLGLALILAAIVWADVRRQIIPNMLTFLLAFGGLARAYMEGSAALLTGIIAGAVTFVALFGIRWVYNRVRAHHGIGMGDVKLLAASALWVGPGAISWLLLVACLSALSVLLIQKVSGAALDRHRRIPFGPHIAVGLATVLMLQSL